MTTNRRRRRAHPLSVKNLLLVIAATIFMVISSFTYGFISPLAALVAALVIVSLCVVLLVRRARRATGRVGL